MPGQKTGSDMSTLTQTPLLAAHTVFFSRTQTFIETCAPYTGLMPFIQPSMMVPD